MMKFIPTRFIVIAGLLLLAFGGSFTGKVLLAMSSPTPGSTPTYYVSTNGNDITGNGSSSKPFRTIQHAADVAKSGDTVFVRKGIYYERIEMKNSGTVAYPITFQGERDSNGKYLSIIDGSDATGKWVAAPEVGEGVYKIDLGYIPFAMILDGDKNVARISLDRMDHKGGFSILAKSASATIGNDWSDTTVNINYWDGINAWFGYKASEDMTYIRIEDGGDSNPNNRSVRSSPGNERCFNCFPLGQAIELKSQSYNTIKDFLIRGARIGVVMRREGSHHNIVEDCEILTGLGRIHVRNSAHDNIIRNNDLYNNMLGFDEYPPGPWEKGKTIKTTDVSNYYNLGVSQNTYSHLKYWVGNSSDQNADCGVYVSGAGDDNEVSGNTIHDGTIGIVLHGSDGTKIYNNTIYNMSSVGVYILWKVYDTEIYDNTLHTSNINLRFGGLERGKRSVYIYQNKFYNPKWMGSHMYLHVKPYNAADSAHPAEAYFYHNSFSGSNGGVVLSPWLG
ncbi:MAG: DUF1565 domain-containing protein, partial [Colwellia sp.]|nr:DUF1565 domain-containing protein [Colwellia sp.]